MSYLQESIAICISKITQQHPKTKQIFDEIYQQGGRVLLVGGAVRDCLLGGFSSDLDFEVYHLSFEELEAILKKFGTVDFVGKSFGVLKLAGLNADWSIPRCDSSGRKPCVSLDPDMNFLQAFKRRDVSINAMGIDVASLELIDPYDGLQDLHKKILRTMDASFFVQDPLRLFRVMQFVARFDMHVDSDLSKICKDMDIAHVSVERIEQELIKLFTKSDRPSKGFIWLLKINRLQDVFPGMLVDDDFLIRVDSIAQHQQFTQSDKTIIGFALLAYSFWYAKNSVVDIHAKMSSVIMHEMVQFLQHVSLSNQRIAQSAAIGFYIAYIPLLIKEQNLVLYKWIAAWIEPYCTMQFLSEVASCWYSDEIIEKFVKQVQQAKVLYHAEKPVLSGQDLLNYAEGKEIGNLLKEAYRMQIEESILDKQKLLKKILNAQK